MNTHAAPRPQAVLLLGPTGSGKTPLGEWLERYGLGGRRCHHFDFGANLRAVAAAAMTEGFTPDEILFVRDVLEKGALLENETFHLAAKLFRAFIVRRQPQPDDLLILNGLPRHAGQADALEPLLDVVAVVHLECTADTVRERIRLDTGGDRMARSDDHDVLLEKKLAIFAERTQALTAHYRAHGVPVIKIEVAVETQPADITKRIADGLQSSRATL